MREYVWIAVVTLVGFGILAFVLLYPVYRHLRQEERANLAREEEEHWKRHEATDSEASPNGIH